MNTIRILVMDVDGTLTDGGVYMSDKGELAKRFCIKDGYAIKHILPQNDIIPAIITGRSSEIVKRRCEELNIKYLIQGVDDKVSALSGILTDCGYKWDQVAYIGDDLNDFYVMKKVELVGCPSDAVSEIKEIADFVSGKRGGEGAVRDFIEWIVLNNQNIEQLVAD